ncbi:MAG: DUF1330 domain-containing protein [Proteobacteria bacterium]|jgi:uncharacterized protein (DUF1330 family)|nr:DUF1330 domain-containing protein [Pseudomonadota bacterium]MDA1301892.1 DUF1330 domain-containing protein [Pseudomonadota bacterium]
MSDEKPAYFVVCGTFLGGAPDPQYGERAAAPAAKAGLMPIAGGTIGEQVKVLEGEMPEGATFLAIEQFPSMAALEEFYFSEAYQSAIPFRKDAVKMNFLAAVEGISEAELEARAKAAGKDAP